MKPRTLRRRLFGSHLQVMLVALLVMSIVLTALWILAQALGGWHELGFGRGDDGGPVGLLLALTAASTAAALVSWRVSRRIASPLEAVGDAARKLAAGRYDVRLPGSDTVELDRLADDVNRLAAELEATEQRRLQLIGDVAHELRNPLATIEGTMEALLDGVMTADPDTFARIARESARLRRLADDLSSLSSAGEASTIDASAAIDLAVVVDHVVAQLEPQAVAKGLALEADLARPLPIRGDADRLTQVVMNVVGNAVQYTDDGFVRVDSHIDADWCTLVIADSGRGLTSGHTTRVFERFYRVDEQFTDGTGVGLAIARLVLHAHGGTIEATSDGPGSGARFVIRLPAAG
ncbi:MAG: HAMP domain-containing sensor histidine kinase [Actinomycetota bacterium]